MAQRLAGMHVCIILFAALASSDRAAVRATLDDYVRAWLANDESRVMQLLTAGSVLVPGEKPPYVGRDAIRDYWFPKSAPATRITRFDATIDDLSLSGDVAYARGTQLIEWSTSGERWRTHGNYVSVLRRTKDGWRIALQMAGNTPAERLP